MSVGPEIRVRVRFWYVVDSEYGHPWAGSLLGGVGLDPIEELPTPSGIVRGHFEVAQEIWARYGVLLEPHEDGISPLYMDNCYVTPAHSPKSFRLAESEWKKGQNYVNVYYVGALGGSELAGYLVGTAVTPLLLPEDEADRTQASAILMAADPALGARDYWTFHHGWALAHEFGHIFGLCHTLSSEAFDLITFLPFEDDTPSEPEYSFNLMSYPTAIYPGRRDDPGEEEVVEKSYLTANQIAVVRLTLMSRFSNFVWCADMNEYFRDEPESRDALYESVLEDPSMVKNLRQQYCGFRNFADLAASFHAAWLG